MVGALIEREVERGLERLAGRGASIEDLDDESRPTLLLLLMWQRRGPKHHQLQASVNRALKSTIVLSTMSSMNSQWAVGTVPRGMVRGEYRYSTFVFLYIVEWIPSVCAWTEL